jgi:hypothetical protein
MTPFSISMDIRSWDGEIPSFLARARFKAGTPLGGVDMGNSPGAAP